jgi:uncharacterized protein (DUF849 family)
MAEAFATFLPQIAGATDAVINISTGGNLPTSIQERIAPALRFSPEICSLNMGSMNFSFHPLASRYDSWKFDWEKDDVGQSDTHIFRDIQTVAETLAPHGIKFEHECCDVGHLCNLRFGMGTDLLAVHPWRDRARGRQSDLHETHRRPSVRP